MPYHLSLSCPIKSNLILSISDGNIIYSNPNFGTNARRHSIFVFGNTTFALRAGTKRIINTASFNMQFGPIVLKYEDIGDYLYQIDNLVIDATGVFCTILETYTDERPEDTWNRDNS